MANPTIQWAKVLIHPLGLAGYTLFLLFGLLARSKRRDERRWILPAALVATGVALLGGIGLAYRDVSHSLRTPVTAIPPSAPTPTLQQSNDHISQSSVDVQSPNLQGVQGSIILTYGPGTSPETQKHRKAHNQKGDKQPQ